MSIFSKVKLSRPKRNKFDLSHERKMSFNMGFLTPILVQDILPGDSFRVKSEVMLRFAPMLAPIMHRVNVFTHYFFVPNRLVWDEWEDFITGGKDGTAEPVHPYFRFNDTAKGWTDPTNNSYPLFGQSSLANMMGFPKVDLGGTVTNPISISALPFRAYQLIYNEYYRDQNLSDPIEFSKASGQEAETQANYRNLLGWRKRAWEKDRFTSALPWTQRGPEVTMPIEGDGDVTYIGSSNVVDSVTNVAPPSGDLSQILGGLTQPGLGNGVRIENIDEVTFYGANTTINDLRRAIKLQEWLEKNARGGARYIEQILSHFGVMSSDARLQRPEYLGGGKQPVVISEVLSTVGTNDETGEVLGNMGGHGISVGGTNGFKRSFEEHGYVIGIMSVLPRTAYQQGLPKHLRRFDKFDYAWPEFANLGEEEIKLGELYYDPYGSAGQHDVTFGYTPRYSDYKYAATTVHGAFTSDLAYWHMGRIFGSQPALNENFVEADPTRRIFAVTQEGVEDMYCQLYNRVDALRPLPYFGTPTL